MLLRFVMAIALAASAPVQADEVDDYRRLWRQGQLQPAFEIEKRLQAQGRFEDVARIVIIRSTESSLGVPFSESQRAQSAARDGRTLLAALGRVAGRAGGSSKIDALAREQLDAHLARLRPGDAGGRVMLEGGMGHYYVNSFQSGLALPILRRELAYWERAGNRDQVHVTRHALARAYWEMGEFELSRLNQIRVIEAQEQGLLPGLGYDVSEIYMNYAREAGDVAMIERVFPVLESVPLTARKVSNPDVSGVYWNGAVQFALAGDLARGKAMLEKARGYWASDKKVLLSLGANGRSLIDVHERIVLCAEATFALLEKRYAEAATGLERCEEQTILNMVQDHPGALAHRRGAAYEGQGRVDEAIKAYRTAIETAERSRSSFTVAERATFFRSALRKPYWGVIRLTAARAETDRKAFFETLHTSELVRGRQLGELIDPNMAGRITPAALEALQRRLPADTLVLAYTVTEGHVVLLGMMRESLHAAVVPVDAARLLAQARAIARDLSRPESSQSRIHAQLLEFSAPLLGAARPWIRKGARIIALPDGAMTMVPFELLSLSAEGYRPLIADHVVSSAPSVAFIEHARGDREGRRAGGLMAVADPRYAKPKDIGGVPIGDVVAAKRGSKHLAYFDPLPETRSEAEAIARMFAGEKTALLLGERAVESAVKNQDLSAFGFLHFATHGILGGEVPGVSEPALVLGEEPGEDGFLTASEVGKLRLNADITVLSACNTGSGEFVAGEGVMGMSRAFLAAGSRSVVVSLWPVASKQTELLMVDFYRVLRGGKPPADALREAKLNMIERAGKSGAIESHPFFWAPFILLGG
jgi:CHAT domain-containing protein